MIPIIVMPLGFNGRDASVSIKKHNILGDGPALEIAPKHMTALWTFETRRWADRQIAGCPNRIAVRSGSCLLLARAEIHHS